MGLEEWDVLLGSAQAGHRDAREKIIERLRPLVIKTASSLRGRFIDPTNDDEISIGMMAVNQAIDTYNPEVGASFLSFAEIIIKRRLIDYYRREQRFNKTIPFSSLTKEEHGDSPDALNQIEHHIALINFNKKQEELERREEIRRFTKCLKEFGIAFSDLVAGSPKHEDARLRAIEVAKLVATEREFKNHLVAKKELPLKKMENQVGVSRKTLERQRKYIIAIALIIMGDFYYLREYLQKVL